MNEKQMQIKFSDYFIATLPRYKKMSELNRKKSYYLSNIHDKLDNYINNINYLSIPKHILDEVLVVDLQKYDSMIDINGDEYDWSGKEYYEPVRTSNEIECLDWYTKKLTAVNHIIFDDILDVESSIIYNLIEITPLSEISVEYLKYYFWYWPRNEFDKVSEGQKLLNRIYEESGRNIALTNGGYERFIYTCELLNSSFMVIDKFEYHNDLIMQHSEYLREQTPNKAKMSLQALFGSPLYQNLSRLEKQITNKLIIEKDLKNNNSYTGFLSLLEEGLSNFDNVKNNGEKNITIGTIFNFPLALEIYIRAKIKLINPNIRHDDSLAFLINSIESGYYLKKVITNTERNVLVDELQSIKKIRNYGGHTGKKLAIEKAQKIIEQVCNCIRKVDEYFIY